MIKKIKKYTALTVVVAGVPFALPMFMACFIPGKAMLMGWAYFITLMQAGQVYQNNKEGGDVVK